MKKNIAPVEDIAEKEIWNKVISARDKKRFKSLDFLENIFTSFLEFHGDRYYGDDKSIVAGIAMLEDIPVTVICQQKGKTNEEMIMRQYGMSMPEGYRKALRLMKQAEKFRRPIVCLIDTPGAFPGLGAEERGQAEAIARNLFEMSSLKVPIISAIISEGGSGGALALGLADKVVMMENSVYSVISPEGCASILWKDSSKAPKAAKHLRISAQELYGFGIIDKVMPESEDAEKTYADMKNYLYSTIIDLRNLSAVELIDNRRAKYSAIGQCN